MITHYSSSGQHWIILLHKFHVFNNFISSVWPSTILQPRWFALFWYLSMFVITVILVLFFLLWIHFFFQNREFPISLSPSTFLKKQGLNKLTKISNQMLFWRFLSLFAKQGIHIIWVYFRFDVSLTFLFFSRVLLICPYSILKYFRHNVLHR